MSLHPSDPPSGIHGVLSVLADAADAATGGRGPSRSAIPEVFGWLDLSHLTTIEWHARGIGEPAGMYVDAALLRRLAAIDAIRPGARSLRLGWLFVTGTTTDEEGTAAPVFEPLVTMEVEVVRGRLLPRTDPVLTPLVTDGHERLRLESAMAFGGGGLAAEGDCTSGALLQRMPDLVTFARQAAAAAGVPATDLTGAEDGPAPLATREGLRITAGLGVWATDTSPDFSPSGSLRAWHDRIGTTSTALHALYAGSEGLATDPGADLPSAYRLTEAQHDCVVRSRSEPVTVISGAPGTGKTHTIAAIIGDAVAHGRTVLVAAKSEATVDAIIELVESQPGPEPVVFGAAQRRANLAGRLAAGQPTSVPAAEVQRRHAELRRTQADRDLLWSTVAATLEGMALLVDGPRTLALRHRLPGLTRTDVDLFEIARLARQTDLSPPSWWQARARRRWQRLCDLLGVDAPPDPADLTQAMHMATAARQIHQSTDPLTGLLPWPLLLEAQQRVEQAAGMWMDAAARDERRLTRNVRAARAALATALRSGRARRRAMLSELGSHVTEALPVWVGTLGDIDDLLPMQPALFDLVVLDEASSIDQPRAATALLRGQRAVIVGDPQQLRHVSFVSTEAVTEALQQHLPSAPPELAARLDVRQNSIFDVAAAVAPVRPLDEHFRSGAHLFAFVGRRLYRDEVRVATLTPATDGADLITVTRLLATRSAARVVEAEVDWVMRRLGELHAEGVTSVGVVSPFRAQADAIEAAVLRDLRFEAIEALGLRVGTVHAFQGMEREVVLASLGIGEGDGAGTWRFAADPHLFAVFATRARRRMEWVVSATPPEGSLIADYLEEEGRPPTPQPGRCPPQPPGGPARSPGTWRTCG
ncbi:hypothetical protein BH23ACT9_BH23ACT9_07750 [soil metagenome]